MSKNAFSLVELSIVLVVIGLIAGGILSTKHLIRNAEVNSTLTQFETYKVAVKTFKARYKALPGDMYNAQSVWGAAGSCPGTNLTPSTDKTTCNGNGDGKIMDSWGANTYYEIFRAWQHLANAGLIEGTYTGVYGSTGNVVHSVGGLNVPATKITGGAFQIGSIAAYSLDPNNFPLPATNMFWLGAEVTGSLPYGILFSPKEANGIDSKIDDGIPSTGKVRTPTSTFEPNCATTNVVATAVYKISYDGIGCSLYLIDAF